MTRPNIVLILADDMGYGDVACFNEESKVPTRHIDALAAEGTAFTDAHASTSVCTPSRYGILTGRYAWRGRLQRGVLGPYDPPLIEPHLLTLPAFLRNQGYHTGCVGKWHLGFDWPFRAPRAPGDLPWHGPVAQALSESVDYAGDLAGGPLDRGFDTYFGVDVPNFAPYCFIEGRRTVGQPSQAKPADMYGTPGLALPGWRLEEIMPALLQKAVQYIHARAASKQPFFLYFPLTAPHTPIAPAREFLGASRAGVYGDFCVQVDHCVGAINDALRQTGLADNTLLIFTSDNGSPNNDGNDAASGTVNQRFGHNSSWRLRGLKADTWDGGHRIPLVARWPGRVPAGRRCDQLVCLMDFFATCASLLEADLPAGAAVDSLNLLPLLLGGQASPRRQIVHHGLNGLYGMRQENWKLILGTGSGGFSPDPGAGTADPPGQLYDLSCDLSEQRNLYFDHPDIVRDLSILLARTCCPPPCAGQPALSE